METKLHVIPTFHHDIAYLHSEAWYKNLATAILDRAVGLMESDEAYTFTVEQAYLFRDYWNEHPDRQEELKTFVRRGQLHFSPGFWVVPDMTMPGGESIYMQASFGRQALRDTVGYEPKTAFIADCWGHHAQLPQILSQCGYRYYVFARCMVPELDRENFRWQGLDGSEIGAHWLSTNYAGIRFPEGSAEHAEEQRWEQASRDGLLALMRRNALRCGDEPQPIPAGGDMAMPSRLSPAILRQMQKDPDLPGVRFSSMDEALSAIDFDSAPVYRGEFVSSLKGTFATNILLKQYCRRTETELYALETLSVLRGKPTSFTAEWETLLKNQFHDTLCGSLCNEALTQAYREYEETLASLERKRLAISDDRSDVRFNPLNFPVSAVEAGENAETGAVLLQADAYSPCRETPLTAEEIPLPESFENGYYRAAFDRHGFIAELWEKSAGVKLTDHPSVPFGSLQLQADSGDNWVEFEYPFEKDPSAYVVNDPDPYDRRNLPTHPRVMLSGSNIREVRAFRLGDEGIQIVQRGSLNYWQTNLPFTITVLLTKSSPRIEYHTELACTSRRTRVRAAFPAAYEKGRIRHQIPFGIVERAEGPQAAQAFVDYETDGAGLALLNRGLPQNNIEGGILMVTLLRSVAMEYKCDSDLSYNLGRTFVFDYAVCPHPADSDDLLWRQALSFGCPPIRTSSEPVPADFAVENAYVSALRYVDGDVFLRVYNGTDREKEAAVRLPSEFGTAADADGCMNPGEWKPFEGELRVPLKPFEVRGLRFRKKN